MSESLYEETPGESDVDDSMEATTSLSYFEGDEGRLTYAQRRALNVVKKHRFITSESHPAEYRILAERPRAIRSHLNDDFLELVVDTTRGIAFKRQAVAEGTGRAFPTLLHDTVYTKEETVLLVFLRERYRSELASGLDLAFLDSDDMLERVAGFRPETATDQAGDRRRAGKAIESIVRTGLLVSTADPERFQISPAIEILLPRERLQALLVWLTEANNDDETPTDDETGEDS